MDIDQSYAPQLPVSKAFLVVVWLSCLQTRPAHQRYPRPPCSRGPWPRDCVQYHLLKSPVSWAETRPPERIASHDSHQPISVSDRSVVSGFYSCPFLCADSLHRFVQRFVGSFWWLQLHRQIPSTRCRRELDLLPCSRIKTETVSLRSKTNPPTTSRHLGGRHQGSSAVDFPALDGHWLSCSIWCAQDPLSLVIHFASACSSVRTVLHAAVSIPNVMVRCEGSNRSC